MHRYCNQLKEGCLSVEVTQIRDPVVARIEDVGEHIYCRVTDTAEHLQVCCSLVCGVNTTDKYLNVVPTMVWLTPEMMEGEFDIISNVDWIIN